MILTYIHLRHKVSKCLALATGFYCITFFVGFLCLFLRLFVCLKDVLNREALKLR